MKQSSAPSQTSVRELAAVCAEKDPRLELLCTTLLHRAAIDEKRSAPIFDGVDLGDPQSWPDMVMRVRELTVEPDQRRRTGIHHTSQGVAEHLARLAIGDDVPEMVWDPACGGGAFLLAAARHLAPAIGRAEAASRMAGCDVDETACAVTRTALALWAAERIESTVRVGDSLLLEHPRPKVGRAVALTNPPFRSPLLERTRSDRARESALAERFGADQGAYANEAALFVMLIVGWLRTGDRAGVVIPRSQFANRDSHSMREMLVSRCSIDHVWSDAKDEFDAAVAVCGIVLTCGGTQRAVVRSAGTPAKTAEPVPLGDWGRLLVGQSDVPDVDLGSGPPLAAVAKTTAGFRDEYYALTDLVDEQGEQGEPGYRLVTTGTIDVMTHRWGERAQRYAKRKWDRPIVPVGQITKRADDGDRSARWFLDLACPKVLVATQSKLIEATVDVDGTLLAVTPVVAVVPVDESVSVWHLAAALSAPPVAAHCRLGLAGSGLARDSIRVSARSLSEIPLPVDTAAWDRSAVLAEAIADSSDASSLLGEFSEVATDAYGADRAVARWWLELALQNRAKR